MKFVQSNHMRGSTEEQELPWVPAAGESTHPENIPQSNVVEPSEIVADESLQSENSPLYRYPSQDRRPPPRYM